MLVATEKITEVTNETTNLISTKSNKAGGRTKRRTAIWKNKVEKYDMAGARHRREEKYKTRLPPERDQTVVEKKGCGCQVRPQKGVLESLDSNQSRDWQRDWMECERTLKHTHM